MNYIYTRYLTCVLLWVKLLFYKKKITYIIYIYIYIYIFVVKNILSYNKKKFMHIYIIK
jgi:hypothetical protein